MPVSKAKLGTWLSGLEYGMVGCHTITLAATPGMNRRDRRDCLRLTPKIVEIPHADNELEELGRHRVDGRASHTTTDCTGP